MHSASLSRSTGKCTDQGKDLLRFPAIRSASTRYRELLAAVSLGLLISACSPTTFLINRLGYSMGSATDVYLTENDPQLVREAFPFNLKTMEMLVAQAPDNSQLLTATAAAFALYSYGFILEDAERTAAEDISAGREIYLRALNLFQRSYNYGLRALEAEHQGFIDQFDTDPRGALSQLIEDDIEAIYWTAASLAGMISASQGNPAYLIHLPKVGYLFNQAFSLNPQWNDGALHLALMKYELSRPDARSDAVEVAVGHYQAALDLSGGRDCSVYLAYAETISIQTQNRQEFINLLETAMAVDVDRHPQNRLSNLLAQDRARWLLGRIDELFF